MPSIDRRALLGALAAGSFAGLAGCSSSCPDRDRPEPDAVVRADDGPANAFETTPATDWPAPRYGPGNAGFAPPATPPAGPLGVRWRATVPTGDREETAHGASSPAVADGTVFVATAAGVSALALRDGSELWRTDDVVPTVTESTVGYGDERVPPVVGADGTVYVGAEDALVALDPADGSERWRTEGAGGFGVPAAAGDAVYAGYSGAGEGVLAVDAADGTERWTVPVDDGVTLPAVVDGTVVVSGGRDTRAVDAVTGEQRWRVHLPADFYPVVADGMVYLGEDDGLHGVGLDDGAVRWTFERGSGRALSPPVVAPDALYVVERPHEAGQATFALDRTGGEPSPRWCSYVGEGAVAAAAGEQAFVVREDDFRNPSVRLVAFTDRFGDAVWGWATSEAVLPPAVLDGAVVAVTRGGTVVALGEGPA